MRIENLPEEFDDERLKELFGRYGAVTRFYVARDYETKRTKGYAYANYRTREEAERTIQHLNRTPFRHCMLSVTSGDRK